MEEITNTNNALLEIEDLHIHFVSKVETVKAINGLNLVVHKGKTLGLVGETGAGKTTTALAILNMIAKPQGRIVAGRITLDGEDIFSKTEDQMEGIRGNTVSMIFQDPMTSLNPVMTVGDQIAEVLQIHKKLSKAAAAKEAQKMLETVGIPGARSVEYPHQFSGGMKQRVLIALGLACTPKLLIADEPTTALDVTIQAQVLELMKDLKDQMNMSMLMITHDLGIVAEVCDEVAVMYAGAIVESGTLEDIFDRKRHPYTEGLFNSLPDVNNRTQSLKPIGGQMPNPADLPQGCSFHPRCEYAMPKCSQEEPPMHRFSETHCAKCWLYENTDQCMLASQDYVPSQGVSE
nr:ABC transporter ATP-binding protein [Lachnospiraceae bacterium]